MVLNVLVPVVYPNHNATGWGIDGYGSGNH